MTATEIRAARMHLIQREGVEHIMAACHMTKQEVLHAIAQYSAECRCIPFECDFCRWRSGDRPCVLPRGFCAPERGVRR